MDILNNSSILIILILIYYGIGFVLLCKIISFISHKNESMENKNKNDVSIYSGDKYKLRYTLSLLKFIRDFSGQVALVKFYEFKDKIDFTKVNEEKVKQLIGDIAITINSSINWNNVDIENSLLNKEFYETYIINTSMIIIKDLTEKAINEVIE